MKIFKNPVDWPTFSEIDGFRLVYVTLLVFAIFFVSLMSVQMLFAKESRTRNTLFSHIN